MKKTEILIGPTPDALVTYADPHRFKWLKLIDRDPVLLIPASGGIHFKAGAGSVSFCLADNTYYKKYPGGMWTNDADLAARAVSFTTETVYRDDFLFYTSNPKMVRLQAPGGYTANATGMSEDASLQSGWLITRLTDLHVEGFNTVVCIFPNGLSDVSGISYINPVDYVVVEDPSIFPALSLFVWDIVGDDFANVIPPPASVTKYVCLAGRYVGSDFSTIPLPAGLLYLDWSGFNPDQPGYDTNGFIYRNGGSIAACTTIQEVYLSGGSNNKLDSDSIDNILADLVLTGSENGRVEIINQEPSATGEEAIDTLIAAGWTVER